jgi:molecular chaperone GrpE (heat shock protein)
VYPDPYTAQTPQSPVPASPADELKQLEEYSKQLEDELARVRARIEELKKQMG